MEKMRKTSGKVAYSMIKQYWMVLSGKPKTVFYVMPNASATVWTAAKEISKTLYRITGAEIPVVQRDFALVEGKNNVFFATIDEFPALKDWFPQESAFVMDHDGFSVRSWKDNNYIFSATPAGVFFGAHDMLERACEVIWTRGKEGEEELFIPTKSVAVFTNYYDKAYFEIRAWHACGMGTHGEKLDLATIKMFGKNKVNGKLELFEKEYIDYGVSPFGVLPYNGLLYFDDLMDTHPEYFMQDFNGKPKTEIDHDSFLNYYRQDVADMCAQKYLDMLKKYPEYANYVLKIKAPDDWHFYMVDEQGVLLHKQPFTADDGTVVYPQEPEYQSTVYWNFVNRMVKKIAAVYPNIQIFKVAYQYCEACPKIDLDEHIIVGIAPLTFDGHYSFASPKSSENSRQVHENIKKWCEKCKKVTIYEYWQCFKGDIYSRPNIYVVQENLLEYLKMGVWGITPEGVVDSANATGVSLHYDMNEMYYWITNKLMWKADENVEVLKEKFCHIAYGDAEGDMLRYYHLIEKGWKERDGYVIYSTGGDVYTKEFIINAGIADEVKATLNKALSRQLTEVQRRKITAIQEVVFAEIDKYSKLVNEDAVFHYTDVGTEALLSQEVLDYKHNKDSAWNKAGEISVFKNYETYEDYDPRARLRVKLLYDDKYLYFGYTVYDDMLEGGEDKISQEGIPVYTRTDGSQILSYAETYVGGNSYNMSKYYGYISGVRHARKKEFYVNTGVPEPLPMSKDFKEAFFKHYDEDPKERYYFHVQAIPYSDLGYSIENVLPYGSLLYYSDRYGRVGWKGNGLWAKHSFSTFNLKK